MQFKISQGECFLPDCLCIMADSCCEPGYEVPLSEKAGLYKTVEKESAGLFHDRRHEKKREEKTFYGFYSEKMEGRGH